MNKNDKCWICDNDVDFFLLCGILNFNELLILIIYE